MKILVTGGAGFIGSHLIDRLIKLDHQVSAIDNLSTGDKKNLNKKAHFYQYSISQTAKIIEILNREKPQIIFHLAANPNNKNSKDTQEELKETISGIYNFLGRY